MEVGEMGVGEVVPNRIVYEKRLQSRLFVLVWEEKYAGAARLSIR